MWGYQYFSLQSWFQLVLHPAWPFTWCTPHIWRRKWQSNPVSLPGKSHGQRSLPSWLQSMGSQRIRHDWVTNTYTYSAYKLNKQGDNIQPRQTPFPILNQSIVLCPVLTVASWPAYRFLRRQVRWSGIPTSLRISHSLLWSTQSKALV